MHPLIILGEKCYRMCDILVWCVAIHTQTHTIVNEMLYFNRFFVLSRYIWAKLLLITETILHFEFYCQKLEVLSHFLSLFFFSFSLSLSFSNHSLTLASTFHTNTRTRFSSYIVFSRCHSRFPLFFCSQLFMSFWVVTCKFFDPLRWKISLEFYIFYILCCDSIYEWL